MPADEKRTASAELIARAKAARAEFAHEPGLEEVLGPDPGPGVSYSFALRAGIARLKAAREAAGLTAAAVADGAGLTAETISRLETGATDNPTWQTLAGYAVAVGCRLALVVEPAPARVTPPAPAARTAGPSPARGPRRPAGSGA